MESEEEVRERLRRLHGQEISYEMGGKVAIAKAKILADILEEQHTYLRGERVMSVTDNYDTDIECVDASDILDDVESYQ